MKRQRRKWLSFWAVTAIVIFVPIGVIWSVVHERGTAFRKLPFMHGYTENFPNPKLQGADLEPLRVGRTIGRTTFITGSTGKNKPWYSNATVYSIVGDSSHRFVWVVSYPNTNFQFGIVHACLERHIGTRIPSLSSLKYSRMEVIDFQNGAKLLQPTYKVISIASQRLTQELVSSWKNRSMAIPPLGPDMSVTLALQTSSLPGLDVILSVASYSPTEAYLSDSMTANSYVKLSSALSLWIWNKEGNS